MKKFINANNLLFYIEALLLFIMMSFFVPTCDDLTFAYDSFFQFSSLKELIHCTVYYGNGRLAGNIFATFFSKFPQLFYTVEYILVMLFCFIVEKLTELKNAKPIVLASVVLIPLPVLQNSISWMSACINYFIPIFSLVLSLLILKQYTKTRNTAVRFFYSVSIILIGISEQLFVEHNAVINALISALIFIYSIYEIHKNKRSKASLLPSALLLISNIIGAAVLFLYKFFINYEDTFCSHMFPENNYRSTAFSTNSIASAINFAYNNLFYLILVICASVFTYSIFFFSMLHIEKKAKVKYIKNMKAVTLLCCSYYPLFIIYVVALILKLKTLPILYFLIICLFGIPSIVGMALLFKAAIVKRAEKKLTVTIILLFVLSLISFSPFLLIDPCGYRCCLLFYFLYFIASLLVFKFSKEKYGFDIEKYYKPLILICCAVIILYTGFYINEKKIYNYRMEYIGTSEYLPKSNDYFVYVGNAMWQYVDHTYNKYQYIPLNEWKETVGID